VALGDGVAQLTLTLSGKGRHRIKAVYDGGSDFASSTSSVLTETVS
jgi:hypothetical protein